MITIINEEFLETIIPSDSLKYYHDLDVSLKERYLQLYSAYNHLLMQYVFKHWGLKRYDDALEQSSNKFYAINENDKDIYQLRASSFFNYFYIRNNIYVERLTDLEQEFILTKFNNGELELDDEKEKLIETTFKKVLLESQDEKKSSIYGEDNGKYIKPSNSIILGVRYDDYLFKNETEEAWEQLHNKRTTELYFLMNALEREMSKKLNLPVSVIQYNEFSVKKKQTNAISK